MAPQVFRAAPGEWHCSRPSRAGPSGSAGCCGATAASAKARASDITGSGPLLLRRGRNIGGGDQMPLPAGRRQELAGLLLARAFARDPGGVAQGLQGGFAVEDAAHFSCRLPSDEGRRAQIVRKEHDFSSASAISYRISKVIFDRSVTLIKFGYFWYVVV